MVVFFDEGLTIRSACMYHKEDFGCVLEELKSPRCIGHYCDGDLRGTSYSERYVREKLGTILAGGFNPETFDFDPPEQNWEIVEELRIYADKIIQEVENSRNSNSE